jgi:hypothetical protein
MKSLWKMIEVFGLFCLFLKIFLSLHLYYEVVGGGGGGGVKKEQPLELCLGLLGPSFVKSGDEIKKSG